MQVNITLSLPRDAASVPVTRQVLDAALQVLGVTSETRSDIQVALTEACANVIRHAQNGDQYEVLAGMYDGRCVIEVVDTGRGFDADSLEQSPAANEESGRGLQIIRALVDNVQFVNRPRSGAIVRFEKWLEWRSDAVAPKLFPDEVAVRPGDGQ